MERGGSVSSGGDGYNEEEMLFTYNEEEKQRHEVEGNNSKLVLNPKFIPFYTSLVKEGYSMIENLLIGFIDFFLSSNKRFYCTNEQLAEMIGVSEPTISNAIKSLEKRGDIKMHKKLRAGGGTIRFLTLGPKDPESRNLISQNQKFGFSKIKKPDHIYNNIIDNNIINNNISNSNELDVISIAPESKNCVLDLLDQGPNPLGPRVPEPEIDVIVKDFMIDSIGKYASVRYVYEKNGEKYLQEQQKEYIKLKNMVGEDMINAVLKYIKFDDFWSKQIQTIGKLRKKDKEGIPYIVRMIDKMNNNTNTNKIIDLR